MARCVEIQLPRYEDAVVVVEAPDVGPGNWAGAASAILVDGVFWLTYRLRRPVAAGRGVSVVVARSDDGVTFEPVCELNRETFGAASFERPVLVALPGHGWRLYLSCATPGSKHWWIEAVDSDEVAGLPHGRRTMVLPGSADTAVKDPVIRHDRDGWQMWVCCHPLTPVGEEDRMTTSYLTSDDGLSWRDHGTVLRGRPGGWDARGTRVVAVLTEDPLTVLYDGRATAEANWFETTGLARLGSDGLQSDRDEPVAVSPHSDRALRYTSVVPLPDGRTRFYFEAARADGSHDLMTSISPS
ncbi:MAG TPA: hypothetical protein VFP89_09255 [Propionibacteriaceae bacterium]|nr:hypothetical protein [Propionibacteriaceae bacterium]